MSRFVIIFPFLLLIVRIVACGIEGCAGNCMNGVCYCPAGKTGPSCSDGIFLSICCKLID